MSVSDDSQRREERYRSWNERYKGLFEKGLERWRMRGIPIEEDSDAATTFYRDEGFDRTESEGEELEWQLTEEWAKRFADSELKRKKRERESDSRVFRHGTKTSNLPEERSEPRVRTEEYFDELYGREGSRIASLEADLNADFDAKASAVRAPLWPCEPLMPS